MTNGGAGGGHSLIVSLGQLLLLLGMPHEKKKIIPKEHQRFGNDDIGIRFFEWIVGYAPVGIVRYLVGLPLDAMFLVGRYLARNCVSYQPGEPRPNSGRQAHSHSASNVPLLMALMSLQCSPKVISLMPSVRHGQSRFAF